MSEEAHAKPPGAGAEQKEVKRVKWTALLVLWLLLVFDGYDLIVYGTVQSSLLEGEDWGLTRATAGTIGSMAFIGMMIGAISAGRLADTFGRKMTLLGTTTLFSIATVACGFAEGPITFGLLRLIAGIGLGGLVPAASALAAELVPANWRSSVATFMLSGVPIGGIAASLVGIELIPRYGWRVMFYIPVIAILVLLPLAIRHIPETLEIPHGKQAVKDHAGYGYKALLRPPYRNASIALSLAAMGTMFAWYGLGTWLPSLMQLKGYDLGSSLSFAIALNCGAVAGSAVTAWAGDRYSPMLSGAVAALLASGSLLAMMAGPPVAVVFGLLILAGVGTHGTQVLLTSTVTTNWPAELRGTALGWTLGVGRIGAIMAPQVAGLIAAKNPDVNFLTFGGAALLASCMLFLVRPLIRKFSVHPERVH